MNQLCDALLLRIIVPDIQFIGKNPISIQLTFDVLMLQQSKTNLIVLRQKVVSTLASDP